MKINRISLFIISSSLLVFTGCATVFKGYEDAVRLKNVPEGLQVFTKDSIEIPIQVRKISVPKPGFTDAYDKKEVKEISIRSNTDHVLVLRNQGRERRIHIYPRIGTAWFIVDCITFTFWVDIYTGNWNYFEEIDAGF